MKEHKRWDFSIFIAIAATECRQPGVPWTTEMCDHRMTTENMSLLGEGMAVINLFRSNERSLWPYSNTSQMHHYRRRELYETSPGEGLVVKNLRHKENSTIGFVKGEKLMNSWLVEPLSDLDSAVKTDIVPHNDKDRVPTPEHSRRWWAFYGHKVTWTP